MNESVWERSGIGSMSKNMFAMLVSFWTAVGIAVTAVGAYLSLSLELNWPILIGVLVAGILGVVIALRSSNPLISLLGYLLVAGPFGLLLGPFVAQYTDASVVKICLVTFGMTVLLSLAGAMIPDSLEGWGSVLFGVLAVLLVGYLAVPVAAMFGLPVSGALSILDWVGIVLFSAYIIYDWNKAMRVPRTHDNAIDCALAIYLDIVNLFIRLLARGGKRKD